jgi:polyisoprenoid-binding protein YceI
MTLSTVLDLINRRQAMSKLTTASEPVYTAIDRPHPPPTSTWTIDPADSSVSLAWRKLRLWTVTGRLHCLGVIHVDDLPPVGVIRFQQPSGLPVLTMALEPASVETGDADRTTMLGGPAVADTLRHQWWTLRSESLEVLPTGTWRVMATLTARDTTALIELHFEIDPGASGPEWLVLRGRGVLDRRAFDIGKRAWIFDPKIQLDLTLHARRAETHLNTESQDGDGHTTNHRVGLSPVLAASPAQVVGRRG